MITRFLVETESVQILVDPRLYRRSDSNSDSADSESPSNDIYGLLQSSWNIFRSTNWEYYGEGTKIMEWRWLPLDFTFLGLSTMNGFQCFDQESSSRNTSPSDRDSKHPSGSPCPLWWRNPCILCQLTGLQIPRSWITSCLLCPLSMITSSLVWFLVFVRNY